MSHYINKLLTYISLTLNAKRAKISIGVGFSTFATVAQLVEQLTRNEQVVRSSRISSSKLYFCVLILHIVYYLTQTCFNL